jgi:aryl-alcohol dehydrogenase-like predicted oxidoreductase
LKRLETDYLDLVQIHWPDRYVPLFGGATYDQTLEREYYSFEEQLRAFDELIKEGKVRHIGISNETPFGVMKFGQTARELGLPKMVSIQNSYSLLVRSDYETGLTEVCSPSNENVGLLAYSPLCGGILTGKYAKADCPPTSRLNLFEGLMPRYKQSLAQEAVKEYSDVAEKYGMTPTELSLTWCYNQKHVASSIIGATTMKQLKENLDSYSKNHLIVPEVISDIEKVYKKFRDPSILILFFYFISSFAFFLFSVIFVIKKNPLINCETNSWVLKQSYLLPFAFLYRLCGPKSYYRSQFLNSVSITCARFSAKCLSASREHFRARPDNGV